MCIDSEGKTINFNRVAKEAKVSKSWLFKEQDIRQRIKFLRDQQIRFSNKPNLQNEKSSQTEKF
jgi:hypothetical protein